MTKRNNILTLTNIVVVVLIAMLSSTSSRTLAFITPSKSVVGGNCSTQTTQSTNVAFINNNRLIQKQNEYILDSTASIIIKGGRSSTGASIQTMGLFGLGGPEIAVILVAAAFLLGPQKLAEFGRDAGKIAGELKEVPKEFQAGIAEGEREAAKMKAENEVMVPAKEETVDAEKTD